MLTSAAARRRRCGQIRTAIRPARRPAKSGRCSASGGRVVAMVSPAACPRPRQSVRAKRSPRRGLSRPAGRSMPRPRRAGRRPRAAGSHRRAAFWASSSNGSEDDTLVPSEQRPVTCAEWRSHHSIERRGRGGPVAPGRGGQPWSRLRRSSPAGRRGPVKGASSSVLSMWKRMLHHRKPRNGRGGHRPSARPGSRRHRVVASRRGRPSA